MWSSLKFSLWWIKKSLLAAIHYCISSKDNSYIDKNRNLTECKIDFIKNKRLHDKVSHQFDQLAIIDKLT